MKERPIAFYAEIARELKSINAAILYQQIRYWSDKGSRDDGWIYKSAEEFESETTLTVKNQRVARNILLENKWIEAEKFMVKGSMTWHYKLLIDFRFEKYQLSQTPVATVPNASCTTVPNASSSITENTTENTTEDQRSFSLPPDTQKASDYQPDYQPPVRKAVKKTKTEKQRAAFAAMRSITYYREKADAAEMTYFAEEDESANRRYQAQAKEFEKRYRNNWKDVIDWWWEGEGEWANFHPSNFFGVSTYMKFDNKDKKRKGGGKHYA